MNPRIKKITIIGMMAAASFVLQIFEFPLPMLIPPFIKFDFSDLPALLTTFLFGAPSGVAVCLVKNVLHLVDSGTGGVGELANFLCGAALCIVSGLIYRYHRTKGGAVAAMLIGSLAMGLASFPINYFITYPFYYNLMPKEVILAAYQKIASVTSIEQALLLFNVPFTMAKGLVCSIPTFVAYKRLKHILKLD